VALALALLLPGVLGCGASDNLPREAISGSVSVEGKPLESGLVVFNPEAAETPTQGGAAVVAGKFSIPREQGLVPGKYKVVVSAAGGTPEKQVDTTNNMPGMPPVPAKEIIPKEFNTNSLLTAEVKAGVKNEFSFNLTASKSQ
jgi:hypothetical protein